MKIQFSTKTFLKAFKIAASVAPTKDWRPILMNVKIIADEKIGTILHATDTEVGIRVRVDATIAEAGTMLVPAKWLIKVLTTLKNGLTTLESDGSTITVTCGVHQWTLPTQRHEDEFPNVAEFGADSYHSMPIESMQQLIKRTITSVDKKDAVRRVLTGVCFESDGESITAVATDGVRMAHHSIKTDTSYKIDRAVVPVPALNLLSKVLREQAVFGDNRKCRMAVEKQHAFFDCGDVTIFSRLLEGRFPQWKSIIPQTENAPCVVDGKELLAAVKRMRILTTDSYPCVLLTFERGKLTLTARGAEVGRCQNTIPLDRYDGAKWTVKLQCKPLIDMLTSLTGAVSIDASCVVNDDINVVKFTDIDGLTYLQTAQAILPEESDESVWERQETKRRHASMRSRLASIKRVVKQYRDAVDSGKDVSESESYVEWLESTIPVLESKCAALPVDDDDDETDEPMDDDDESEPIAPMAEANVVEDVPDDEDVIESESEVELDSEDLVTWECFDTLPFLVSLGGINVNLTNRPAFCPDTGLYLAVADGDEESYMVEWRSMAERCDWRTPYRILTLDEYNAENVGNVQCHVNLVAAEPAVVECEATVQTESAPVPDYVPDVKSAVVEMVHNSALLPDVLLGSTLATVQRENGDVVSGAILAIKKWGQIAFMEWESGRIYRLPSRCFKRSKGRGITTLSITDGDLSVNLSLLELFMARSLF